MSFSNFGGGLVNTIVAGAGNNISTGLANQFSSNIQFSVGSVLAGAVQDTSGYALNAGQSYLLNQVSSLVPPSVGNGLANAVVTQVAQVGLNAATSFASQTVTNILAGRPAFEGLGGIFGGGQDNGTSGGGAGGFIGLHAQNLPDADYGDNRFTTKEIVFSIVPSNAGPQTQAQPQSSPTVPWTVGFDEKFSKSLPGLDALKGQTALAGPAQGLNVGGRNYGSIYSSGRVTTGAGLEPISPGW